MESPKSRMEFPKHLRMRSRKSQWAMWKYRSLSLYQFVASSVRRSRNQPLSITFIWSDIASELCKFFSEDIVSHYIFYIISYVIEFPIAPILIQVLHYIVFLVARLVNYNYKIYPTLRALHIGVSAVLSPSPICLSVIPGSGRYSQVRDWYTSI